MEIRVQDRQLRKVQCSAVGEQHTHILKEADSFNSEIICDISMGRSLPLMITVLSPSFIGEGVLSVEALDIHTRLLAIIC